MSNCKQITVKAPFINILLLKDSVNKANNMGKKMMPCSLKLMANTNKQIANMGFCLCAARMDVKTKKLKTPST
jgi:hypothetical protein